METGKTVSWYRKVPRTAAMVVVAASFACSGSTTHTHVERVARAKQLPNAPYARVLIVGIAERASSAREFEEVLAKELNNDHTYAFGYHRAASRADVKEDVVRSIAELQHADAVLVITARLVSAEKQVSQQQSDLKAEVKGGGLVDFFRYDYKELTAPKVTDFRVNVQFTSNMFDVASDERIYTVETRTDFADTTSEIIVAEAGELAKRLRKDKMVR